VVRSAAAPCCGRGFASGGGRAIAPCGGACLVSAQPPVPRADLLRQPTSGLMHDVTHRTVKNLTTMGAGQIVVGQLHPSAIPYGYAGNLVILARVRYASRRVAAPALDLTRQARSFSGDLCSASTSVRTSSARTTSPTSVGAFVTHVIV
jgi:hypothetical protein